MVRQSGSIVRQQLTTILGLVLCDSWRRDCCEVRRVSLQLLGGHESRVSRMLASRQQQQVETGGGKRKVGRFEGARGRVGTTRSDSHCAYTQSQCSTCRRRACARVSLVTYSCRVLMVSAFRLTLTSSTIQAV